MKEKLTLRNVIILSAAFIAVVVFGLSFLVRGYLEMEGGKYILTFAVYRPLKIIGIENGHTEVIDLRKYDVAIFALPLIGVILTLVSAAAAVVVALIIKDEKVVKIALLACGVLAVTGGVFQFFVGETALRTFVKLEAGSLDQLEWVREMIKKIGGKYYTGALGVVDAILAVLAGCALAVAPFLPEKKLVK